MQKKPTKRRKTITVEELSRLSFCNSKKLPLYINDGGIRKHWIGIGWIAQGKATGREVKLIREEK